MDCISGAAVVSSVFDFVVGWRGLESFDHWLCPLLPISEAEHTAMPCTFGLQRVVWRDECVLACNDCWLTNDVNQKAFKFNEEVGFESESR